MTSEHLNDLDKRIEQPERRAAESALIADLSPRSEIRVHNARLADEPRQIAAELKVLQAEWPWAVKAQAGLPSRGIS